MKHKKVLALFLAADFWLFLADRLLAAVSGALMVSSKCAYLYEISQ